MRCIYDTISLMPRKTIPRRSPVCLILLLGLLAAWVALQGPWSRAQDVQPAPQPQHSIKIFISALKKSGQTILDLTKEEIQVVEDKREDQILSIKPATSEPLRAGILVDVSASGRAATRFEDPDALSSFISTRLGPKNFAFVATFSELGKLVSDWADSPPQIGSAVRQALSTPRHGGSSIYSAIYWACETKLGAREGNKFLLVMTDMEDDSSHHTQDEAVGAALRAEVPVFVLLEEPNLGRGGEAARARRVANEFAEGTGGLAVEVQEPKHFRAGLEAIGQAMAGRYELEFAPPPGPHLLAFYKIKVTCSRKGVRLLAPSAYFVGDK
jgi:VWFA-related protein